MRETTIMQRRLAATHRFAVALAIFGMSFSGFSRAADTSPAQRTIAVLTPAVPERFLIHAGELLPTELRECLFDSSRSGPLRQ
jgi:hypothetical protein